MRFPVTTVARPVDQTDLSDLTTARRTGPATWTEDGQLDIPFSRALTPTEVAAIVTRLTTVDSGEETLRKACETFLKLDAPTAEQTSAQVKVLTRIVLRFANGGAP